MKKKTTTEHSGTQDPTIKMGDTEMTMEQVFHSFLDFPNKAEKELQTLKQKREEQEKGHAHIEPKSIDSDQRAFMDLRKSTLVDTIVRSKRTMSLDELAELLRDSGKLSINIDCIEHKMDGSNLLRWFKEYNVIDSNNIPTKEYINNGWFAIAPKTDLDFGAYRPTMTLRVTGLGLLYLVFHFLIKE